MCAHIVEPATSELRRFAGVSETPNRPYLCWQTHVLTRCANDIEFRLGSTKLDREQTLVPPFEFSHIFGSSPNCRAEPLGVLEWGEEVHAPLRLGSIDVLDRCDVQMIVMIMTDHNGVDMRHVFKRERWRGHTCRTDPL